MALTKSNGAGTLLTDRKPSGNSQSKASVRRRKSPSQKPSAAASGAQPVFKTSMHCWPPRLPQEFVAKVQELENLLKMQVWLVVQGSNEGRFGRMDFSLLNKFVAQKANLPKAERSARTGELEPKIAVLIDSVGGSGEAAYQLATVLQRRCRCFAAVIPRWAKSAATLLSLGASTILLGEDAELGPLDAQVWDFDVEETLVSALDEVQAVEALEQSATHTAMKLMNYLHQRTGKSFNVLMPHALHFAAELTKPLFDKIDAVRYSRQSRRLQEAQDYAERLLRPRFSEEEAKAIAKDLVRNYPTHDFVIDRAEARRVGTIENQPSPIGLQLGHVSRELDALLDWFYLNMGNIWAIGRLESI